MPRFVLQESVRAGLMLVHQLKKTDLSGLSVLGFAGDATTVTIFLMALIAVGIGAFEHASALFNPVHIRCAFA